MTQYIRVVSAIRYNAIMLLFCGFSMVCNAQVAAPSAGEIIRAAMDHWRGVTSYSLMTMTIHRPDWQREIAMYSWTEGDKRSLVRVVKPKKDAGNGTLLNDNKMWTYSPKVNRVIKIPSAMMAQSWMGSDFSNKDISRSTDIIDEYEHSLSEIQEKDGHMVYIVTSIPKEEAAVVWGKEVWTVRDDFILLKQEFWDQDGVLVKTMETLKVDTMGGRSVASLMRMQKVDVVGEWTQVEINDIAFNVELSANTFTLSNLRNPR